METIAAKFRGVIEQLPPRFSAKKINGVPAYKLARNRKEVTLKPVQVEIKEFEILPWRLTVSSFARASLPAPTCVRSLMKWDSN